MKTIHNTKIIGIDHGYGNMKTANCCFPTGITAYDHEPLFTADMLVYGGRYYLIGEGHKEFAPDKIKDEDYYVLTLAAIAKELKTENLTEAHIVIAAGLPLTWTSGRKADFKEYLMKNAEVEFTYKKADYHIYIDDVRIYPQGYAAIASFATALKGVNLIGDIGNGTMNTLYMINGKPQQGKMFTEKFGTYQCTLAAREAFMQRTQREINDAIIDEVLITGTANIAPADLKIIKGIAAEYVRDIFRRLREHGYDENTMILYVTGGGGCLVKNFYKFNADRVKFIEDICAAAKGYEYLAEAQMKAEAKKKLFAPEKEVIGTCPRCGQPVYEGKKNFACSDRSCGFVLWKNDRFWTSRKKELTKKMATDLLKKGRTNVKGMWSEKKQAAYDAAVILDDTGGKYINFKLEFPKRKEGVNGRK